jgi:O-succinylbenzoic acid--CoA ligase
MNEPTPMNEPSWRPYLELHPDDPFWRDDLGTISRAEMGRLVDQRADELTAAGVTRGRRAPLTPAPTRETVIEVLAVLAAGATVVLLPLREPASRRDELARGVAAEDAPPGQIWVRTSGTSGRPRWLVHTATTLMAAAEAASTRVAYGRGASWRVSLPLDHVGGLSLLWRAVVSGGSLQTAARDDATHRSLVPTQLHRALAGEVPSAWRESRCLLLGGAPLPADLRHRTVAEGLPLRVSYGLTETAALVAASLPGDARLTDPDYAGRPLWRRHLAVGEDGVVRVAGPSLAIGEADDLGRMAPLALDDAGWFVTGDLGALDGDALRVTGRRDHVMISGGEKLAAEELEAVLLELPGVLAAVVVPVDDAEFGQRPVAFLATGRGSAWTTESVREALTGRIASWKRPDHVWLLPEDAALKSDRAALRKQAAARVAGD